MRNFGHILVLATFSVFVAGGARAFDLGVDTKDILRYAHRMILSSCLGESFMTSWEESMKASTEKCFGEESIGAPPTLTDVLADILSRRGVQPNTNKSPPPLPNNGLSHIHDFFPQSEQHPLPPFNIIPDLQSQFSPYPQQQPQTPSSFHQLQPPQHSPHHPTYIFMVPPHHQLVSQNSPHFSHFDPQQFHSQGHPSPSSPSSSSSNRMWKRSTTNQDELEVRPRSAKILKLAPEWRITPSGGEKQSPEKGEGVQEVKGGQGDAADTLRILNAAPRVNVIRRRLGDRISNITCVLKSMELLDESHRPNYSYNTKLIEHLNVPSALRQALVRSQDFCREFSSCVPVHRSSNLLLKEVGQGLVFLKCLKDKVIKTCVSQGLRTQAAAVMPFDMNFDLENLIFNDGRSGSYKHDFLVESPRAVAKNLFDFFSTEDEADFGF